MRIELAAGGLAVALLPEAGGKVASLRAHGHEWLAQPAPDARLPARPGVAFVEADMSGWDEMLPTIDACRYRGRELPDHGDLWDEPWEVIERSERAATLRSCSRSLPLELTRRVAVDAGTVRLDYELRNLGDDELAFLWAAHPQFRCAPGTRVRLPEHVRAVVNARQDRHGDRGSLIGWPVHDGFELDRIGPVHLGTCRKLYVPPDERVAEASLSGPDGRRLTLRWEPDELPYLGVWIDEGRYSREPVCALEPATAFFDSLAEAVGRARAEPIRAGAARAWTLAVSS